MTRKQDERDTLRAALADEQARLRCLELEQGAARARIAELGRRLEALEEHPAPADESTNQPANEPRTPAEKVTLFRRLFRGRPDVYPIRFVSKKTGKAGYAPACANKFVDGVCQLPKVKWRMHEPSVPTRR